MPFDAQMVYSIGASREILKLPQRRYERCKNSGGDPPASNHTRSKRSITSSPRRR